MGIVILGLWIPLRTSSAVKIENREYPVVYATYSPLKVEKPLVKIEYKIEYKTSNHKILKAVPSKLGYNCVTYVKAKANIGTGYGSLAQKKTKIKSLKPKLGVALTAEGPVGHLVYVEKILDSDLIISEGNYRHGYITWRQVPKTLILGYF